MMVVIVLVLLAPHAAMADQITITSSGSTQVTAGGTLSIIGAETYPGYAWGGAANQTQPLNISLGSLALAPSALLNSAVLDFSATVQDAGVTAAKSEINRGYTTWEVVGQNCYWSFGWYCYPIYGSVWHPGSPGSATFSSSAGFEFTSVSAGGSSLALTPGQQTVDLLAAGFGPDLRAGAPLVLSGIGVVQISSTVTYYGYYASSTYNFQDTANFTGTATLSADYSAAPSVPEPASMVLLASGLGLFARRRRQKIL